MSLMAVAAAVILCSVSIFRGFHGQTFMGRPLGGDFIEFYVIGTILNHFQPARIYDLQLAVGLQHSILPSMAETQMLVYGHAPYVATLFKPFALLPYRWAYVAWLGFSAALYLASIALLFPAVEMPAEHRKTAFLLAVSFTPFLFETWIGGQLSVVAFFFWVLFFYCRHRGQPTAAGIVLALGLFKPTLILLPVAMLILGRRWRMFWGFAAGAAAMALISVHLVGTGGCRAWIDTLLSNAKIIAGPGEAWHLAKSVDAVSFFHLLFFNASPLTGIGFAAVSLCALAALARAWLRSNASNRQAEDVLWAATLCMTIVINSYAPIYDSILVVGAAALSCGATERRSAEDRAAFRAWLLLLYMTPWVTQSSAEFLHLQLVTPLLAGFGIWLLRSVDRAGNAPEEIRCPVEDTNLSPECYTTSQ